MSWQDRIQDAVWISPSGRRFTFDFEDLKSEFEKKAAAFEFPDADGTYIQDLGYSSRRFPMVCYFNGAECDRIADEFELGLKERGEGTLEHPLHGVFRCIPFGTVTRYDKLVTAANQVSFSVVFWQTIGLVYPTPESVPQSEILQSITERNQAAVEEYAQTIKTDMIDEQLTLRARYDYLLGQAKQTLQSIADTQQDVQQQFDAIASSIDQTITTLIADPLTIAFQTTLLIESPARARDSISRRLQAYRDLAQSIITGEGALVAPTIDGQATNTFQNNRLFASSFLSASVVSVMNAQFETKLEALNAADTLLLQLDEFTVWNDQNFDNLVEVDIGTAYQQLQEAIALTAGYLVFISFSLKQERYYTLDRDRTIIDTVAELYGSVDDQLDFFITSNDLSGDEIVEIPRGKTVVYYV